MIGSESPGKPERGPTIYEPEKYPPNTMRIITKLPYQERG
jgi:hypothetical protein